MKEQILYAFWKYDICPYMIGGEIVEFCEKGRVKIKGYQTLLFRPIQILEGEEGKRALAILNTLKDEFDVKEKELKTHYKNLALENIGLK